MDPLATPEPLETELVDGAVRWFDQLLGAPLTILLTLVGGLIVAAALRWGVTRAVNAALIGGGRVRRRARRVTARVTRRDFELGNTTAIVHVRRVQRAHTVAALLRAASTFTVSVVVVISVLHALHVDIAKLLTAAGVVSVVLGFGAQTLIRDVLAGLAMILEEQFGVGDVVEVGERSGTVEEIRLRISRIRDDTGTVWYLRNGDITSVGNRTQGWSLATVDFPIRYDQDLAVAEEALLAAGRQVCAMSPHNANVTGEPFVDGIEDLTPEAATLRVQIKTVPTRQWEIARALRAAARLELAARGVILAGADSAPDLTVAEDNTPPAPSKAAPARRPGPLMPPPLVPLRQPVLRRKAPPARPRPRA